MPCVALLRALALSAGYRVEIDRPDGAKVTIRCSYTTAWGSGSARNAGQQQFYLVVQGPTRGGGEDWIRKDSTFSFRTLILL